jgi:hypothetical protein
MPEAFGGNPEVIGGVLYREAAVVWRNWNPLIWIAIRFRGCLGENPEDGGSRRLLARAPRRRLLRRLLAPQR